MRKTIIALSLAVLAACPISCDDTEIETTGSIYGMVSDADSKDPVTGAQVTLSPGNITTVTGSDGFYEFQNVEEGQYKLTVMSSGYKANTRQVTVTAGERAIGDIQIIPEETISGIELSTENLDFGTTYNERTLDITNVSTSGSVDWYIDNISADWLTVSPLEGSIGAGKSVSIKVAVDRSLISGSESTSFNINADGGSIAVTVSVGNN